MKYTGKATPDTVNIDVLEKIPIKLLVKRGDLFNELEDPVFLDERVQERVYALYAMTYARTPTPKLHPSKRLHKYNYWILITDPQISDQIEKIVGFALYRTHACGLKLGLTGTMQDLNRKPGTKETDPKIIRLKLAFLHMHAQLLNLENNFGEASKPIDEALIRRGAPKVKAEDAKKVLSNKSITVLGDGYYYKRFIDSVVGYQEKILLGKPIILP